MLLLTTKKRYWSFLEYSYFAYIMYFYIDTAAMAFLRRQGHILNLVMKNPAPKGSGNPELYFIRNITIP